MILDHFLEFKESLQRVVSWTPSIKNFINKPNLGSDWELRWVGDGLSKSLFDLDAVVHFLMEVLEASWETMHGGTKCKLAKFLSGGRVLSKIWIKCGDWSRWLAGIIYYNTCLGHILMTWATHPCTWVLWSKWGSMLKMCDHIVLLFDVLSAVMQ